MENSQDSETTRYHTIVLPTRSQPDTIVAIFILRRFGEITFPGISKAKIDFWQMMPAGETEDALDKKGVVLIDLGGGRFDHHAAPTKTTASDLIAGHFGVEDDPALAKLLEYARRDDFYGKGTVSEDPLDRAFGLSALIANLNRTYVQNPEQVVEIVLPIIKAHYTEESRRTKELPAEFAQLTKSGGAKNFETKQRDKKLSIVVLTSDNASMSGYLRSQSGGRFDVVAQWLSDGHLNILTRPAKRVDLRSLVVLLRLEEATRASRELSATPQELAAAGRMKEIPEWYYDPATNSIQNGGLNPKEIPPTRISKNDLRKILELGLSETLWKPR